MGACGGSPLPLGFMVIIIIIIVPLLLFLGKILHHITSRLGHRHFRPANWEAQPDDACFLSEFPAQIELDSAAMPLPCPRPRIALYSSHTSVVSVVCAARKQLHVLHMRLHWHTRGVHVSTGAHTGLPVAMNLEGRRTALALIEVWSQSIAWSQVASDNSNQR